MRYFCKVIGVVLVAGLQVACSVASEGERAYKRAQQGRALVVPSPLSKANVEHEYDLPYVRENASIDIKPPA